MLSAAQRLTGTFDLVADIGGTHTRFGLADSQRRIHAIKTISGSDFDNPLSAIRAYLDPMPGVQLGCAALAVATSISGDQVKLTNHPWEFSIQQLQQALGVQTLLALNDFAALAHALPFLNDADLRQVGTGQGLAQGTKGVLGPGTGLGVAGLVPHGQHWIALPGEGGHASVSPADDREAAILAQVRQDFPHVSWERLVSGIGLPHLLRAVATVDHFPYQAMTPAQITHAAMAKDPLALAVINTFCALLGSLAGNLALTLGATGGIYIGGGIVPKLRDLFEQSPFRQRFSAKGRFQTYLENIATWVITAETPALIGAAHALDSA